MTELLQANLNVERSQITFSDLPVDVLEKVVGKLTLPEFLVLRKVSADLRNLVDSMEIGCAIFRFRYNTIIEINGLTAYYGGETYWISKKWKEIVKIDDALAFLKHPKRKFGRLEFNVREVSRKPKVFLDFLEFLKSLDFRLNVHSINITTLGEVMFPILQFFEPSILKDISFGSVDLSEDLLNELLEMEQWKKAKKLSWYETPQWFPMDKLLHFEDIQILQFNSQKLTWVRDNLLKSAHLKSCHLRYEITNYRHPKSYEEEIDEIMSQNPSFDSKTRQVFIANSRHYFQLEYKRNDRCTIHIGAHTYSHESWSIKITKTERN